MEGICAEQRESQDFLPSTYTATSSLSTLHHVSLHIASQHAHPPLRPLRPPPSTRRRPPRQLRYQTRLLPNHHPPKTPYTSPPFSPSSSLTPANTIPPDGIPTFTETPSSELNDVLSTMRTKHFVPAALHAPDRRLIFGTKHRQTLADNPQTVTVGDEDITLQWIDRRTEIPNRRKLFHQAIALMAEAGRGEEGGKEWANLPNLLIGLRGKVEGRGMGKVVRKAVEAGRIGIVVQCLQQGAATGMTLDSEDVLENVMWGLHATAQRDGWTEEGVSKALKAANQVALLLETEEHGGGRLLSERDPRQRPEVLGVFLELVAVQAYRFQNGQDVDGKVKAYTERLLGCIDGAAQPPSHAPSPTGPQYEMRHGIPIYHGLHLAERVLGKELPNPQLATRVRRDYEAGLTILAQALEAQGLKEGGYGEQAVKAWRECIRD